MENKKTHSLDVTLNLFDDNEGVSIQIRQYPDLPIEMVKFHQERQNK